MSSTWDTSRRALVLVGCALSQRRIDRRNPGGVGAVIRPALGEAQDLASGPGLVAEEAECSGLLSERLLQRTREAAAPPIGAAALALGGDDGQDVGQEPPS